ncbi:GntR family transcriptional regulator [Streptomyces sp. CB03234]|uniref:MocR-like pyridoxine biosynthesis transcription factor PdxR n=1 Tax=Streptomyces sp. (strain CB03234) TaxID=1703937 RepID=UPI00094057A5|nr:PLP-dependent aminotransferase family protein [Streptomyces sp. CB03234]OKK04964.1 GntR family transcriptional regulator [Streptomyces sp. CB03234]
MNRSNGDAGNRSIAAGADFLQLNIAEAPAGRMSEWLADRLRHAIADGSLPVGSRLPATRVLAGELRVSRGVVTEAYQRLTEDGHVVGRRRGGTIVVAAPLTTPQASARPAGPGVVKRGSSPGPLLREPERRRVAGGPGAAEDPEPEALFTARPGPDVFDALRAAPARIDLSPGVPDLAAFPRTAWLRTERAVLNDLFARDLGYGDPRGAPELRRAVADWLARNRGFRPDPDEVLVTSGTAQALGLLGQVLHGDGVRAMAVEDPCSLGARQHLHQHRLTTPPVPVDGDGVRVDALRATGAPAVLLTPAHQFPTGVVLSGARRRELMRWAVGEGGLVVEDDYDAEHRYDRPPVPALRSVLAEHVCYAGSVSKLLAPALRIGWMIAPRAYRGDLVDAKRYADLGNATLPQLVLARLMDSGAMERHLRLLRRRHRQRRDAMIAAIRTHLPGAVVGGAAAGLHLTVMFGSRFDDTALAAAALARGVKTQPLSWHRQSPGPPGLVLGYAAGTPTGIAEGVALLGAALRGQTACGGRRAHSPSAKVPNRAGPVGR